MYTFLLTTNPASSVLQSFNFETIMGYVEKYAFPILYAVVVYVIGNWLIKRALKITRDVFVKKEYDLTLQNFLISVLTWTLKAFLIVTVISMVGIQTTSFAAIIASAGLAIGLALQGSLSNFAGGVLIAIFKPYKIGDMIEAQGIIGAVKEIEIFTTKLITPTNQQAIVPNGAMANGNIINFTAEGRMRVDLVISIGYEQNIKTAKDVLLKVMESNDKILNEPAPSVNVMALADSSVDLAVRPFCKPEDYWTVYFETLENCKLALDAAGIEIPYPHQVEIQKRS